MDFEKLTIKGIDEVALHYKEIMKLLGEDTQRDGLLKTPERAAKAKRRHAQQQPVLWRERRPSQRLLRELHEHRHAFLAARPARCPLLGPHGRILPAPARRHKPLSERRSACGYSWVRPFSLDASSRPCRIER